MKEIAKRLALFIESVVAAIITLAVIGGAFYYIYLLVT